MIFVSFPPVEGPTEKGGRFGSSPCAVFSGPKALKTRKAYREMIQYGIKGRKSAGGARWVGLGGEHQGLKSTFFNLVQGSIKLPILGRSNNGNVWLF